MSLTDTIFAVATGNGISAVAIVRLSGPRVGTVLDTLTGGRRPRPRQHGVRRIHDPVDGGLLDVAVVVWVPGPESYTGEDCGELHLHGSHAVIRGVLRVLGRMEGLRPAEPGEFTRRAFANGKMDLIEVEGLADLLSAQTESQRRQAIRQMAGDSRSVFESWRERLVEIRAFLEATVDFADEDGVENAAARMLEVSVEGLVGEMTAAIAGHTRAELVRGGVRVALVGPPNTGKSSLLNALAGRDVALVSAMAGTTRDVISVTLDLDGMPVIVSDMAGLREDASDEVEQAGIRRAWSELRSADILVWVCAPDVEESRTVDVAVSPDLIVAGKTDMGEIGPIQIRNDRGEIPCLKVSARTGFGMAELGSCLSRLARERVGGREDVIVTNARQAESLLAAVKDLEAFRSGSDLPVEIRAELIRSASESIGRLTGRIDVEEWLGTIFGRFCVGK